ncbi:hypothetical protein SAMN04487821_1532 [Enterococcus malodoratus]|uniref:conjugal transfer protein n=1 Tax=Enterococcus malodoratus TaxID=71451 RepID=UPI0008C3C3F5|nr:conjugal transfer protein [Enterococcus malodoratus]SEU02335.1 hypothetical protein SAMN04487821_1532 [Enterococcus malodoratus]
MLKVKVLDIPVFYAGKRYKTGSELTIKEEHQNSQLFELLETVEDNPFKGVKSETIRKALEKAEVEIPESIKDREELIQLFIENDLTL